MNLARKFGHLSSIGLALIGIVYAAVVVLGITAAGFDDPIEDPILAVMEILTLISAILMIVLLASIVVHADGRKIFGVIALAFGIIMALQRVGILGYGIALPIACLILARFFGCQEVMS